MKLTMSEISLWLTRNTGTSPQLNLAKTETKWLKTKRLNTEKKLMTVVLKKWGLTIGYAELKIVNQFMRDLDAENLNLHHANM